MSVKPRIEALLLEAITHVAYITPQNSVYKANTWLIDAKKRQLLDNCDFIIESQSKHKKHRIDAFCAHIACGKKRDFSKKDFYKFTWHISNVHKLYTDKECYKKIIFENENKLLGKLPQEI